MWTLHDILRAMNFFNPQYILGQLDLSYSLALVHWIPSWLVWSEPNSWVKMKILNSESHDLALLSLYIFLAKYVYFSIFEW